jgi:hypothetical protein
MIYHLTFDEGTMEIWYCDTDYTLSRPGAWYRYKLLRKGQGSSIHTEANYPWIEEHTIAKSVDIDELIEIAAIGTI